MTLEKKINFLRIALNIQQIGLQEETIDKIVCTYDALLEKEGKLNLEGLAEIKMEVEARHTQKSIIESE
jgi:predicted enzyme involved in methoxymalonyl-ACP biosynthesis